MKWFTSSKVKGERRRGVTCHGPSCAGFCTWKRAWRTRNGSQEVEPFVYQDLKSSRVAKTKPPRRSFIFPTRRMKTHCQSTKTAINVSSKGHANETDSNWYNILTAINEWINSISFNLGESLFTFPTTMSTDSAQNIIWTKLTSAFKLQNITPVSTLQKRIPETNPPDKLFHYIFFHVLWKTSNDLVGR